MAALPTAASASTLQARVGRVGRVVYTSSSQRKRSRVQRKRSWRLYYIVCQGGTRFPW